MLQTFLSWLRGKAIGKSRSHQWRKQKHRTRLAVEFLEDRVTPATFSVSNVNSSGAGSLRQAIINANALAGADVIRFTSGAAAGPIILNTALPFITDTISIDGSQLFFNAFQLPNPSGRPLIEIDGRNTGDFSSGLRLTSTAGGSSIKGLVINHFDFADILLESSNNTVKNCWLGVSFDGNSDATFGDTGVRILGNANNNVIGGLATGERNVISGHFIGVLLSGAVGVTMDNNQIVGNFVGTNATGNAELGNNTGVYIANGPVNTLVSFNVLSGNRFSGLVLEGSTVTGTKAVANRIGVANDGTTPLGNDDFGILVANGAHDNDIGGPNVGNGNIVAFNGQAGIVIGLSPGNGSLANPAGTGNTLLRNLTFGSLRALFITEDGVNFPTQDILDADSGPNGLQNFPDLTSAIKSADGRTITVAGSLSSKANRTYRIEVFSFDADSQIGAVIQDMTFHGFITTTTNGSGLASFSSVLLTPGGLPANARILATATDLTTGDTSNFSVNIAATAFPMVKDDALTPVIFEGGLATLSGQLVDPDPTDFLTLRVDWGDGSRPQDYHPGIDPFAVTHQYADNGVYDVTFSWFAQVGGVKSRTKQVTVLNDDPTISGLGLTAQAPHAGIYWLEGVLDDPGLRDTFEMTIDWGDGKTETVHRHKEGPFRFFHRYRASGTFTVQLTALDDDGGMTTQMLTVNVD